MGSSARGDLVAQLAQCGVEGVEFGIAIVGEQLFAVCDDLREHLAEHRFAGRCEPHEEGPLVVVVAFAYDESLVFQAIDHAGQRALGDQGAFAQFLVAHPRRVAQCGNDIELRMRQPVPAHRFSGKTLEALHALGQQPDTL